MIDKLKNGIVNNLSKLILIFLVMQPLLDVFSYFLAERLGSNTISTLLRFAILAIVAFTGFFISGKKKTYIIIYSVMIVFWILHAANCFRIGYSSIYEDTANYLRIISLPVYTLSFMTFFDMGKNVRKSIYIGFAANFAISILFTAIPWLLFEPVYTYERLNIGVMGWFSVKNAQSAILCLLTPLTIFFAYKTKKYIVYLLSLPLTFAILFYTGTKLTFYTIFLTAIAFIFLFIINLKKESMKYLTPILVLAVLCFVFRAHAPMYEREKQSVHASQNYGEKVEEVLSASGESKEVIAEIKSGQITDNSYRHLMRIRKSLTDIYTDRDVYGKLFADINSRFGVYSVMKAYDYTAETTTLSDTRERKTIFAKLVWDEKDWLTKLFGYEYSDMIYNENIYDLENDFPAVFFFCGYVGFSLYMLFFIYFIFIVVRRFWRTPKTFLSIEMGAVGMTFILAAGSAQISGNVLRRPNVTAYFAIIAALLYHLCVNHLPEKIIEPKRIKEKTNSVATAGKKAKIKKES